MDISTITLKERKKLAFKYLEKGWSIKKIMDKTGMNYKCVWRYSKLWEKREGKEKLTKMNKREKIYQLFDEGLIQAEVARKLEISTSSVSVYYKEWKKNKEQVESEKQLEIEECITVEDKKQKKANKEQGKQEKYENPFHIFKELIPECNTVEVKEDMESSVTYTQQGVTYNIDSSNVDRGEKKMENLYRGDIVNVYENPDEGLMVEGVIQIEKNGIINEDRYIPCSGAHRPAVVIQNNIGNMHSPNIIVAFLTTVIKKADLPTHHIISEESYNGKKSMIMAEQVRTVNKQYVRKVGKLSHRDLEALDIILINSLGLSTIKGLKTAKISTEELIKYKQLTDKYSTELVILRNKLGNNLAEEAKLREKIVELDTCKKEISELKNVNLELKLYKEKSRSLANSLEESEGNTRQLEEELRIANTKIKEYTNKDDEGVKEDSRVEILDTLRVTSLTGKYLDYKLEKECVVVAREDSTFSFSREELSTIIKELSYIQKNL